MLPLSYEVIGLEGNRYGIWIRRNRFLITVAVVALLADEAAAACRFYLHGDQVT